MPNSQNPFEEEILRLLRFSPEETRYLETKDVAELTGMSGQWVGQHARGVLLPKLEGIKMGPRKWKFTHESVEKFLKAIRGD